MRLSASGHFTARATLLIDRMLRVRCCEGGMCSFQNKHFMCSNPLFKRVIFERARTVPPGVV